MEESAGSADREMGIAQQSITFKLNALKETWTGTLQQLLDRETLGNLVDSLTKISEVLGWIIDKLKFSGIAGVGAGLFAGIKGAGRVKIAYPHLYTYACCNKTLYA